MLFKPLKTRRRFTVVDVVLWALQATVVVVIVGGIVGTLIRGRYSAGQWFDFCIFGLTIGSVYALIALGYTMVYAVLRMINFAHGDTMMAGAFGAYFAASALEKAGYFESSPILAIASVFAVAIGIGVATAVLIERIAYRPFRRVKGLAPLICAIGVSFFLQQTFRGAFGSSVRSYPDPKWMQSSLHIGGVEIPYVDIWVMACALTAMLVLYAVVNRTRMGTALRAVAEDTEAAAMMGIDVDRVVVFTFALAGATAGVAGVCYAFLFKQVNYSMGLAPGIKAFGAAILGGIGSVPGAMFGGVFLGLFESVGPALFLDGIGITAPYQLRDLIAYTLLIAVLIFRPRGILADPTGVSRA